MTHTKVSVGDRYVFTVKRVTPGHINRGMVELVLYRDDVDELDEVALVRVFVDRFEGVEPLNEAETFESLKRELREAGEAQRKAAEGRRDALFALTRVERENRALRVKIARHADLSQKLEALEKEIAEVRARERSVVEKETEELRVANERLSIRNNELHDELSELRDAQRSSKSLDVRELRERLQNMLDILEER